MELGEKERQCRVALEMIIKKRATREQKKKKTPVQKGREGPYALPFMYVFYRLSRNMARYLSRWRTGPTPEEQLQPKGE